MMTGIIRRMHCGPCLLTEILEPSTDTIVLCEEAKDALSVSVDPAERERALKLWKAPRAIMGQYGGANEEGADFIGIAANRIWRRLYANEG